MLNSKKKINTDDLYSFYKLIKKRCSRNPVAHLTNKKFFWNSEFYVTKDTLIPRPDTEVLIQNVLKFTKFKRNSNILDIGSSVGFNSIGFANKFKESKIIGIEPDQDACLIAQSMAKDLKMNKYQNN